MNDLLNPHMWDLWDTAEPAEAGFWEGYEEWLDQLQPGPGQGLDRVLPADGVKDELPF